jgi:hypothetical protein
MYMAIERRNSFHLMLSDDELKLLRLLAEQEGLSASDYLRTIMRRMAGPSPQVSHVLRLADLLKDVDLSHYTLPGVSASGASGDPRATTAAGVTPKKRRKASSR